MEALFVGGERDPRVGDCVIAIDLGTTRTVATWGYVPNPTKSLGPVDVGIFVPLESTLNGSTKAETVILLDGNGEVKKFGTPARKVFHHSLLEGDDFRLFEKFKMELLNLESSNNNRSIRDTGGRRERMMTVFSKALEFIGMKTLETVNETRINVTKLRPHDIFWIVTIPAIWNEAATGFMRLAAREANLIPQKLSQHLSLIREPEAAWVDLAYFHSSQNATGLPINEGDKLLILDLGGGTNDMTFWQLQSKSLRKATELMKPMGGSAGAALIEKQLEMLFAEILPRDLFEKIRKGIRYMDMMHIFETTTKFQFRGVSESEKPKPISFSFTDIFGDYIEGRADTIGSNEEEPDEMFRFWVAEAQRRNPKYKGLISVPKNRRTLLNISERLLQTFFDHVIGDADTPNTIIGDLSSAMMREPLSDLHYVFFAGGFSKNLYLKKRVKEFIKQRSPAVHTLDVPYPDLSIARGACLSTLLRSQMSIISKRKAPYCYGIITLARFDSSKDAATRRLPCRNNRVEIFDIHVHQDDDVDDGFIAVEHSYFPLTNDQNQMNLRLMALKLDNREKIGIGDRIYSDDNRLEEIYSISLMLPKYSVGNEESRSAIVQLRFAEEIQMILKDGKGEIIPDEKFDITYNRQGVGKLLL